MTPSFSRFFRRIREKALDVRQPPVLVAALGDSVTQGEMDHRLQAGAGSFLRLLQGELETFFPTTTFSTINAGVSGDDAPGGLSRLERDILRHEPDLVLIGFGLNDSLAGPVGLPAFAQALREIITRIRAASSADTLLLTPNFIAHRRSPRIHPDHEAIADQIIAAQTGGDLSLYADAIGSVADDTSTPLADIHRAWQRLRDSALDTDLWLINGLNHPDLRGHRLAATIIWQRLLKDL